MTPDGYWGALKAIGVTPTRKVSKSHWVGQTRQGDLINIPDPEFLAPQEREAVLALIRMRAGSWEN